VFEAGEASGVLFIAMRYVRGGDARTLLDREGPLSPARATEIISQVASALDDAHAHGLVHRDVKPANMLLDAGVRHDRPDHVYLSDFGLSKQSLALSGLTLTGQFLGTPDYVAPEQIEGRPVDGRADLYALACAAFELLSGEPPFKRDQGLAVVYAQLSEPPPALSARRLGLPPAVDQVFARALAKAPADRYATCRDFAAALRDVFGLRPLDSGPRPIPGGDRPKTEIAFPVAPTGAAAGAGSAGPNPRPPVRLPRRVRLPRQRPFAAPDLTRPGQARLIRGPCPPLPAAARITVSRPDLGGARARRRPRLRQPPRFSSSAVVHSCCWGTDQAAERARRSPFHGALQRQPGLPKPAGVRSANVAVGKSPWAVQLDRSGMYSFVSLGNSVAVLQNGGGLAPTLVRTIPAPGAAKGEAITSDGRYLLVAGNHGAVVINVQQAEQGAASPVVGKLTSPQGSGATQVALSPDDKFAFVTLQNSARMAVFNLQLALSGNFSPKDYVGSVPLGT
jgi:serine/threonine-protein kinase